MNHSGHMDHSSHMDHARQMDHSSHLAHLGHGNATENIGLTTESSMGHEDHSAHINSEAAHTGHGDGMEMMKMYFHTGVKEIILFESWSIDTVGGLIGSMIGIFLMAMFYEGLKYYREHLYRQSYAVVSFSCIDPPNGSHKGLPTPPAAFRTRMISLVHMTQTFLHLFQVTLSYFLMLIFMTYNVWLCLAVVLGAAAGFFIFGWKKAMVVDITEHCH